MPDQIAGPTEQATVARLPERARYQQAEIEAILDEGFVCHVGVAVEGRPRVIPTSYARLGNLLYLHGSPVSALLASLRDGAQVCVAVTLVDGLVLARSAFHHSVNYRSVVLYGLARAVTDEVEKAAALAAFVEHIVPGRGAEARPPSRKELAGTLVLALPLAEASAKVRSGPPADDPDDLGLPVWAGELPLPVVPAAPIADAATPTGVEVPGYVVGYRRPAHPGRG